MRLQQRSEANTLKERKASREKKKSLKNKVTIRVIGSGLSMLSLFEETDETLVLEGLNRYCIQIKI